jgi:hypothetical protein
MVHTCNPSTQKAEAENHEFVRPAWVTQHRVLGQHGLHREMKKKKKKEEK